MKDIFGKEAYPSDEEYLKILDELNANFSGAKIKFVFDYCCVDRYEFDGNFTHRDIGQDPDHTATNAINVYSESQYDGSHDGIAGVHSVYSKAGGEQLAHEIGHFLGLDHTMGYACREDEDDWDCKDQSLRPFALTSDGIDDTGCDPYYMNLLRLPLDPNGNYPCDERKWVQNCIINGALTNLPTLEDACHNSTTAWNIPYDNFMSYYSSCRNTFSPKQIIVMRNYLKNPGNSSIVVSPCNDGQISDCLDQDIIVSSTNGQPVIWDMDRQLCKDQKIVVMSGTKLILDHCHLSKKYNQGTCPGLSRAGNWDGIYLQSNAKLEIKNSSIVENSNNGIVVTSGYSNTETVIESSIFKENHQVAQLLGTGHKFSIIGNSIIDATNGRNVPQINLFNTQGTISDSYIYGNSKSQSMGIHSCYGILTINNSSVYNFGTAISKNIDDLNMGNGFGLYMDNTQVLNSNFNCLVTQSNRNIILNSTFDGIVVQQGLTVSEWNRNYFKGQRVLELGFGQNSMGLNDGPRLSNFVTNNYFEKNKLELYGNEELTDVTCNRFHNVPNAIYFDSKEGMDWGNKTFASGNYHTGSINFPVMEGHSKDIQNFEYCDPLNQLFCDLNHFTYAGRLSQGVSQLAAYGCNTRLNGTTPTVITTNCDFTILESSYQTISSQIFNLNIQINQATDPNVISELKSNKKRLEFEKSRLASDAVHCLQQSTSPNQVQSNNWLNRLDPELIFIRNTNQLWMDNNFQSLPEKIPYNTEDQNDFNVMQNASNYLYTLQNQNININNLGQSSLDELSYYGNLSFGNYTNMLRAWLMMHYGIYIPWPHNQNYQNTELKRSNNTKTDKIFLYPNPTSDILGFLTEDNIKLDFIVEIFDSNGKLRESKNLNSTEIFYLGSNFEPGIYYLSIKALNGEFIENEKLIIK